MKAIQNESFDLTGLTRAEATDLAQLLRDVAPFSEDPEGNADTAFSRVYFALTRAGIEAGDVVWQAKRGHEEVVRRG